MDEPEQWRWIWLGVAVLFGIGEMATPGSFFLAPFAIGALVAAVLAFADVPLVGEWAAFVGVSVASFVALRPLARRLDVEGTSDGIGARRLIGRIGTVVEDLTPGGMGMVRVDHEDWRAESPIPHSLPAGTAVRVTEVEGTRVIVTPVDPTKEQIS